MKRQSYFLLLAASLMANKSGWKFRLSDNNILYFTFALFCKMLDAPSTIVVITFNAMKSIFKLKCVEIIFSFTIQKDTEKNKSRT